MEGENVESAHLTYLSFTVDTPVEQTNISFRNGDFIDIKITASVAAALLESAQGDEPNSSAISSDTPNLPSSAATADPDATIPIRIPLNRQFFGAFSLRFRSILQDIFWRTGLNFQEICWLSVTAAILIIVFYLLLCGYVYCKSEFTIIAAANMLPSAIPPTF